MPKPRIAIVGAGPGGLTLARILHLHGIPAPVFEREKFSAVRRRQGGSLDMHAESGQFAIQCAGLNAEFKRIARYEDQESRVYDKHGKLLFAEEDVAGKDRPEVDRGQLRQMLLDSLPAGVVHWDHELSAVQPQRRWNSRACVPQWRERDVRLGGRRRWRVVSRAATGLRRPPYLQRRGVRRTRN